MKFLISAAFAVLVGSTTVQAVQSIKPFAVIPADKLEDPKFPGRDFYLVSHQLRLDIAFNLKGAEKMNEKWVVPAAGVDPLDVPSPYEFSGTAEIAEITLTSVRRPDQTKRFFMAFGRTSSFFRDNKFTITFTEDGYLAGADASYEDKTLGIIADTVKVAALFGPQSEPDANEKVEKFKKVFSEAARLKKNIEQLQDALAKAEDEMTRLAGKLPGSAENVAELGKAIGHLRTEVEAATAARGKLLTRNSKSAVVHLVVILPEIDAIEANWTVAKNGFTRTLPLAIPTDAAYAVAWEKFSESVKKELSSDAVEKAKPLLPTKLTLSFEAVAFPSYKPTAIFGDNSLTPYRGMIYRRPRQVSAILESPNQDGSGSIVILKTDGPTLRVGQLGEVQALPLTGKAFTKGDLSFAFSADGEVVKASSGNTAVGSAVNTAAAQAQATYQAVKKSRASGGFDTDLLNADTARMKAELDNIKMKESLDEAKEP